MPSTLVLNADRNVRAALRTWIDNNTDVLLGFSLRINEHVLAELQLQWKASYLNIQPTLALEKGGDIARQLKYWTVTPVAWFIFPMPAQKNPHPF